MVQSRYLAVWIVMGFSSQAIAKEECYEVPAREAAVHKINKVCIEAAAGEGNFTFSFSATEPAGQRYSVSTRLQRTFENQVTTWFGRKKMLRASYLFVRTASSGELPDFLAIDESDFYLEMELGKNYHLLQPNRHRNDKLYIGQKAHLSAKSINLPLMLPKV